MAGPATGQQVRENPSAAGWNIYTVLEARGWIQSPDGHWRPPDEPTTPQRPITLTLTADEYDWQLITRALYDAAGDLVASEAKRTGGMGWASGGKWHHLVRLRNLRSNIVAALDEARDKTKTSFIAKVVPRSAGNSEPFQCRIYNHPNQTLVPDGIYERVGGNED